MRIGIDLGGSKIEGILLSYDGEILNRTRLATIRHDYNQTLIQIKELIESLDRVAQIEGPSHRDNKASIGIGTPGAISSQTGCIKNSNSTWLNGKDLKEDLEKTLGRPVRVANDANCFALSEAIDGAGADSGLVFGVILGTGTGAGICWNKQILIGRNSIAGEWGHNPLPWPTTAELPGPECYCGQRGCIETYLSGPGLAQDYAGRSGQQLNAEQIISAAAQGNELAQESLNNYYDRLTRGLAQVINILDPDTIILGGGISNLDTLYSEIPARWENYIFSDSVETKLCKAKHGDSSGVRGAAWLWNNGLNK